MRIFGVLKGLYSASYVFGAWGFLSEVNKLKQFKNFQKKF